MQIDMKPVESSQISHIGYDAATERLAIQFKKKYGPGTVYHYNNVKPELYAQLESAESIGSFFGSKIKPFPDLYPYTKQEALPLEEQAPSAS